MTLYAGFKHIWAKSLKMMPKVRKGLHQNMYYFMYYDTYLDENGPCFLHIIYINISYILKYTRK